jgi:predicted enzyme related to lactoylglutathione lyase
LPSQDRQKANLVKQNVSGSGTPPASPATLDLLSSSPGRFCWLDLAARDAGQAIRFYEGLFGWSARTEAANGGVFQRFVHRGRDIGSLYQISAALVARDAPSYWMPYVAIDDIDDTTRRAAALGGAVIVPPFKVSGVARIALIADAVGAHVGLWAPLGK